MSWLDPVRAALDAAPVRCPVFFRDDDAGWANGRLQALLDLFERRAVALDVAVIPRALDLPLAGELRARARAATIRLHQHGYSHANHEAGGRKYEFGPSRSPSQQAADVADGRALLREAFGDLVDPVFTPPWNRCTPDTTEVLVAEGFEVLSRDGTAPPASRPGLAEVPVTVDWFGHHKGVRWTRMELSRRIGDGISGGGPTGVMLHHGVSDASERAAVDDLLAVLAAHPGALPTTIRTLAGDGARPAIGPPDGGRPAGGESPADRAPR